MCAARNGHPSISPTSSGLSGWGVNLGELREHPDRVCDKSNLPDSASLVGCKNVSFGGSLFSKLLPKKGMDLQRQRAKFINAEIKRLLSRSLQSLRRKFALRIQDKVRSKPHRQMSCRISMLSSMTASGKVNSIQEGCRDW